MLEVIVALSIVTVGMLGVASLVTMNIQAQTVNRNRLIASMLAQEGLELVRNIRDTNWLDGSAWHDSLIGTFTIDYDGTIDDLVNDISDPGARLNIDASGFYTHAAGDTTPFRRLISVTDIDMESFAASSTVQWTDNKGTHSYVAETLFYNWK